MRGGMLPEREKADLSLVEKESQEKKLPGGGLACANV